MRDRFLKLEIWFGPVGADDVPELIARVEDAVKSLPPGLFKVSVLRPGNQAIGEGQAVLLGERLIGKPVESESEEAA